MCKQFLIQWTDRGSRRAQVGRDLVDQLTLACAQGQSDGLGVLHRGAKGSNVTQWARTAYRWFPAWHPDAKPVRTTGPGEGPAVTIGHARYATCAVRPDLVHPFVVNRTAVTHNGVLYLPHQAFESDSLVAARYLEGLSELDDMRAWGRQVEGYGSLFVSRPTVTDIICDGRASLYYVRTAYAHVWSTVPVDIKGLKWWLVLPGVYRFDARHKLVGVSPWTWAPVPRTQVLIPTKRAVSKRRYEL